VGRLLTHGFFRGRGENFTAFFGFKREENIMTILGKNIRMERIINRNTGKTVIVPMDHGISVGPIDGLRDMKSIIQNVAEGGANAILEHKGLVGEGHR